MPETLYVELSPAQEEHGSSYSFLYVALLAAVAICSGIANGYNGTVLEGTIPRLQYSGLVQAPLEIGLLEGALSMGGLVGSLVCAELAIVTSRRFLVIFGEGAIVLGVLSFALVGSEYAFAQALFGRIITGIGVGVCGLAKPLIVSELAPPRQRGLLVAFFAVGQSIGMNLFFLADWALPPPETRWAWRVLVVGRCRLWRAWPPVQQPAALQEMSSDARPSHQSDSGSGRLGLSRSCIMDPRR